GAVEGVYPPLVGSEWVRGDEERLIKVVLKGLWGPIEVNGVHFDPSGGVPPMTGFESLLSDEEIAATLSYVRKAWGNDFESVEAESVRQARQEAEGKSGYYTVEELLREHPFESR